jgi:hypothetical protein
VAADTTEAAADTAPAVPGIAASAVAPAADMSAVPVVAADTTEADAADTTPSVPGIAVSAVAPASDMSAVPVVATADMLAPGIAVSEVVDILPKVASTALGTETAVSLASAKGRTSEEFQVPDNPESRTVDNWAVPVSGNRRMVYQGVLP